MAPLYSRYIPPKPIISDSNPAIKGVASAERPTIVQQTSDNSRKRKRDTVTASTEALQDIEVISNGSHRAQKPQGAIEGEDEEVITRHQPSGEFAHIRSTKKRHKLEKEARTARKLADRSLESAVSGTQRYDVQSSPHTGSLSSTRQASHGHALESSNMRPSGEEDVPIKSASAARRAKRKEHQKERDVESQDEDDGHLEKHKRILNKFEKSQALRGKEQQAMESAPDTKPAVSDPVRPLEPFAMHLDGPKEQNMQALSVANLPPWLANPTLVSDQSKRAFSSLNLSQTVLEQLHSLGFQEALPVQQAIIPLLLPPGSPGAKYLPGTQSVLPDLAVSAPTGSGKTLAYLLPMLETLRETVAPVRHLRGLVIVPTRELVTQVAQVASDLVKGTSVSIGTASTATSFKDEQQRLISQEQKYNPSAFRIAVEAMQKVRFSADEGSLVFDEWLSSMEHLTTEDVSDCEKIAQGLPEHTWERQSAVDVLICTPGRLVDHISTSGFSLTHVSWLIIDEADKLLDEQYGDFLAQVQHELTRERKPFEQDARERYLRAQSIWDEDAERSVRKVILSATMTRDVSQLALLQLQRPQLIVVQQAVGDADDHDEDITVDLQGADQNATTAETLEYQLPQSIEEFCVPAGDGEAKPLYLLKLLEATILKSERGEQSDDYSDSDSASSFDSSSGSDNSSSTSSRTSTSSESGTESSDDDLNEDDLRQRRLLKSTMPAKEDSNQVSAPTLLIFAASNEAAVRLSYLLQQLLPHLASSITTLTRSQSGSDVKLRLDRQQPCLVIATDRAGRGLDKLAGRAITHVIQYDVPRSVVSYVHRVGRTARAGRPGQAWTLYTNTEARWFLRQVTKTASVKRPGAVKRMRFTVDDEETQSRYEDILAEMKESVDASSRRE